MKIRIGTRGSDLALCQTRMVMAALAAAHPSCTFEIIEIKTSGDKKQGTERARFGDKKDWVYELELALVQKEVDFAVHSAKDVPGNTEPGLGLLPVLERATPFDIFIGKERNGSIVRFRDLKDGSKIGTSSLRRKAALTLHLPSLMVQEHRGNVPTRIRKLNESDELSGIILAAAGVERLKLLSADRYESIPTSVMVPSCNQGILVTQFRDDDSSISAILNVLSTPALQAAFAGERACAHTLQGDCNSAIGVFGSVTDQRLTLEASVYDPKGTREIRAHGTGNLNDAISVGKALASELLEKGAGPLLV